MVLNVIPYPDLLCEQFCFLDTVECVFLFLGVVFFCLFGSLVGWLVDGFYCFRGWVFFHKCDF